MTSKKKILDSVLVRGCVYHRLIGLGSVLNYLDKKEGPAFWYEKERGKPVLKSNLPPTNKEGFGTHMEDNGGLFLRKELVPSDLQKEKINLQPFKNLKPTKSDLEEIVRVALMGEKATLLSQEGYAYRVELNNIFYPQISTLILKILAIEGKLNPPRGSKGLDDKEEHILMIRDAHIPPSYLPSSIQREGIEYGCRSELASYLAVCSSFWKRYATLTSSNLKFNDESELIDKLKNSKKSIKDGKEILIPSSIIHCHNSRLIPKSVGAPISILGYGNRFGEFGFISFEEDSTLQEDLKSAGKKRSLNKNDALAVRGDHAYYGVFRLFSHTHPGHRPRGNIMVISPERDLKLTKEQVSEAIKRGYDQVA